MELLFRHMSAYSKAHCTYPLHNIKISKYSDHKNKRRAISAFVCQDRWTAYEPLNRHMKKAPSCLHFCSSRKTLLLICHSLVALGLYSTFRSTRSLGETSR